MNHATDLYLAGYVDACDGLPCNLLCKSSPLYCSGYVDGLADSAATLPDLDLPAAMAATVLEGKAVR